MYMIASVSLQIRKLDTRLYTYNIWTTMTPSVTSQRDLECCPSYSCLGEGGSMSKLYGQYISRMNANIVIIFLGYTWSKTIFLKKNKTCQDRRSTLLGTRCPWHINGPVTLYSFGVSRNTHLDMALYQIFPDHFRFSLTTKHFPHLSLQPWVTTFRTGYPWGAIYFLILMKFYFLACTKEAFPGFFPVCGPFY